MGEEIPITLKPSKGDNIEVMVDPTKTVLEVKRSIAEKCGIPAEEQRLIFKGQLLKDESPLAAYGPSAGVVLHLVRGRSAQAAPDPAPAPPPPTAAAPPPAAANPFAAFAQAPGRAGGLPGGPNPFLQQMMAGLGGAGGQGAGGMPGLMGMDPAQLMQDPLVQQMTQQLMANPALLQQMMQSPMVQQMMANNPMFNDPQMMQRMADPQTMQMMAQLMGGGAGAGAGAGAAPAAFPGLGGLAGLGGLGGLGALGGMGMPQGPPPANARELYATQLQQMVEMGFPNEEANLAALHSVGGSVTMAVDRLLQSPM